jgi:hypothetical protein
MLDNYVGLLEKQQELASDIGEHFDISSLISEAKVMKGKIKTVITNLHFKGGEDE